MSQPARIQANLLLPFAPVHLGLASEIPAGVVRRYPSLVVEPSATAAALTPGRVMAQPFLFRRNDRFNRVSFEVTVLSAGNMRFAAYSHYAPGGRPGQLLVDWGATAGEVSTGATGVFELTIPDFQCPGVPFWIASVCSGSPTVRCGTTTNIHALGTSGFTLSVRGVAATMAYGAFPASFPSADVTADGNVTMTQVRYAAP